MDYSEALGYLYGLGHEVMAAKYRLETISTLLEELGNPHKAFSSVLVAGTNGKGSTAAMIEAVARAAGHRTGLYTSPHLIDIEERIKVAGQNIARVDFARHASQVRHSAELLVASGRLEAVPSFFEQVRGRNPFGYIGSRPGRPPRRYQHSQSYRFSNNGHRL